MRHVSVSCAEDAIFSIEHSLDGGATFRKRSSFQHNSATGEVSLVTSEGAEMAGMSIIQEEVDAFKGLLSKNAMYTIRIHAQANNCSSAPVYAAIPACELQKSNFKEDLALHLDRDGSLVGLHLTSPVVALNRPCDPRKISADKGFSFQTKLRVVEPTTAGVIPVQATGPRPPALANVKIDVEDVSEGAKAEANQSFLRKYWYIVLPMVLFTLFGGGVEEGTAPAGDGKAGAPPVAASTSK